MKFSLKDFDILGLSPSLYVESEKRKLSLIGGIMSIFTVILLLIFIIYFICEVFVRQSFVFIFNQTTDSIPYLDLTKIPLAFRFYDIAGNLMPIAEVENQIRLYAEITQIKPPSAETGSTVINSKKFNLEKCDMQKHFGNYTDLFAGKADFSQYYCLPNDKQNLSLYGNWADSTNPCSFLDVRLTKCLSNDLPGEFSEV